MRLFIIFLFIGFLFSSCEKEENGNVFPKEEMLVFSTYENLFSKGYPYPTSFDGSRCWKCSGRFYFFKASDIEGEIIKEQIHLGEDWWQKDTTSVVIDSLYGSGVLPLSNGELVKSILVKTKHYKYGEIEREYVRLIMDWEDDKEWSDLSHNIVSLPVGEYFVVVTNGEVYSGKYIDVVENMVYSDRQINVVIPYDPYYKGYFDWITAEFENK